MKRYRVFDTVTLEIIDESNRKAEMDSKRKILNTSPCAVSTGNGYTVRFALQDTRYPRIKTGGLPEPALA